MTEIGETPDLSQLETASNSSSLVPEHVSAETPLPTRSEARVSKLLNERNQKPQELAFTYFQDSIEDFRQSSKAYSDEAAKPDPEGRLKNWLWKKTGGESEKQRSAQLAQEMEDIAAKREAIIAHARQTGDFQAVEDILAKDAHGFFVSAEMWLRGPDSSYGKAANDLDEGFMALTILKGLSPQKAAELRASDKQKIDKVENKVGPVNILAGMDKLS